MLYVRPIEMDDLDALVRLARRTGYGLTTLPPDPNLLAGRIRESLHGFSRKAERPAGETYLLVLVDPDEGLVGISGMVSKVGGFEPFYTYRLETEVHVSKSLQKRVENQTLHLAKEHNGPSEIGSLFLSPAHRRGSNGRLLSLSRFLFMADHPQFFDEFVLAEMRGRIDHQGQSPFWEAVGRHFFRMEFPHADYLVMQDKSFLAELMPLHPIYVSLLPKAAQDVINQVHPDSAPALHLLESEGFERNGMIDIFEGGPVVSCRRNHIRTVRESKWVTVANVGHGKKSERPESQPPHTQGYLLSNGKTLGFRACVAHPVFTSDGIEVSLETAAALQISKGDGLRIAPLRASSPTPSSH
jgi:arginine N-succinyltransferase